MSMKGRSVRKEADPPNHSSVTGASQTEDAPRAGGRTRMELQESGANGLGWPRRELRREAMMLPTRPQCHAGLPRAQDEADSAAGRVNGGGGTDGTSAFSSFPRYSGAGTATSSVQRHVEKPTIGNSPSQPVSQASPGPRLVRCSPPFPLPSLASRMLAWRAGQPSSPRSAGLGKESTGSIRARGWLWRQCPLGRS